MEYGEEFRLAKILMVVQRLWQGGGTETHVLSLAVGLQKKGHSVGIFTSGGAWAGLAKSMGLQVHIPSGGFSSVALQRTIQNHRYKIVHAHDSGSYRLVSGLPTHRPILAFATVHGLYVDPVSLQRVSPKVRVILATSPAIKRFLIRQCSISERKIHVVPNGISTQIFTQSNESTLRSQYHISDDAFVIGYAGRFTFDKLSTGRRISRILSMYSISRKNVCILIAGRNSKISVSPRPKVTVMGHVPKMQMFYNACNVVIGTGRVAIESMCCGVPTIAVGHARYFGRVLTDNLPSAFDTNFGDHALDNRPWQARTLVKDIQFVQNHRILAKSQAQKVKGQVRWKCSLENMIQGTLRTYRA